MILGINEMLRILWCAHDGAPPDYGVELVEHAESLKDWVSF
jgi:hypothetical protein